MLMVLGSRSVKCLLEKYILRHFLGVIALAKGKFLQNCKCLFALVYCGMMFFCMLLVLRSSRE